MSDESATTTVPRDAATNAGWQRLHEAACAPYRPAGRFAWHFARGKLGRDPVFRGMLERGDVPAGARVLDIGCGQGLFASLLAAIDVQAGRGDWPAAWPSPPTGCVYHGIELMPRDVARAASALAGLPGQPRVVQGDMCSAAFPPSELVLILDVLHYVDHDAQAAVLSRVRDALLAGAAAPSRDADPRAAGSVRPPAPMPDAAAPAPSSRRPGRLLLRIGDQGEARGFAVSQWVDRVVTTVRGHRAPPTWGRDVAGWVALLVQLGFRAQPVPMSQGTPFANVLLVADLDATSGAAA